MSEELVEFLLGGYIGLTALLPLGHDALELYQHTRRCLLSVYTGWGEIIGSEFIIVNQAGVSVIFRFLLGFRSF